MLGSLARPRVLSHASGDHRRLRGNIGTAELARKALNVRSTPPTLGEALQYAHSAHRAGHYAEAERVYRLVLRAEPKQFDALHLLGVLEAQRGRKDEALRLLNRAINVNPRSADA